MTGLLSDVRGGAASDVHGPLVICIDIGPGGEVEAMRPILDRLASTNGADVDAVRTEVAKRLGALRFPAASAPTRANIPLIF